MITQDKQKDEETEEKHCKDNPRTIERIYSNEKKENKHPEQSRKKKAQN